MDRTGAKAAQLLDRSLLIMSGNVGGAIVARAQPSASRSRAKHLPSSCPRTLRDQTDLGLNPRSRHDYTTVGRSPAGRVWYVRLLRFVLDGHRSVEQLEFEAGPFTVLFGKNNAGKTNVLPTIVGIFSPGADGAIR